MFSTNTQDVSSKSLINNVFDKYARYDVSSKRLINNVF